MANFEGGDLPDGQIKPVGQNEVALDSHVDDPPKFRLGVKRLLESWGRSLGAFSGDLVHQNGSREEMVLVQLKETEDAQGRTTRGGELYVGLKRPGTESKDDAMIDVLVANVEQGFHFRLPVYAPNLTGETPLPQSARVSRFWSDDGRYVYNVQGDATPEFPHGRIVQYATNGTTDESQWTPVAIIRPEKLA